MVKMFIVLVSTMSYLQVFLLKNVSSKDISKLEKLCYFKYKQTDLIINGTTKLMP